MSQTEPLNSRAQAYPGELQTDWAGCTLQVGPKQKLHTQDLEMWRYMPYICQKKHLGS